MSHWTRSIPIKPLLGAALLWFSLPLLTIDVSAATAHRPQRIYLSADFSVNAAAAVAIEQGIVTALAERNNQLGGRPVELLRLDHRGSTPRAKRHLLSYLDDPDALLLFSGMHSPPLLAHREYINLNQILVLDPWAAAGPITRYPAAENWIFRLSVDDTKAGHVIARYAVKHDQRQRPALLLEQTGWGHSNERTMTTALNEQGITPAAVRWFNWGLSLEAARILIRECRQQGADALFLVANTSEGKTIASAMVSLPPDERLPIYSHWGITGGDFAETIDATMRQQLQLQFIQTRFSFLDESLSPLAQQVLARAYQLFPDKIRTPLDINPPTGFIHAYDLTRILLAAADQIPKDSSTLDRRDQLRRALEQLDQPIEGLIKRYHRPFSRFASTNPDAHEALGMEDLVMARYGPRNEVRLLAAPLAP